MSLKTFLLRMPKVELHVHLEGSMRPSTLLFLAKKNGLELPADDLDGLRQWFRFRDFEHFVEIYLTCSECLTEPEDFHRLAMDFLAEQERQNVLYSEVHFTISTHVANGRDGAEILDALNLAIDEGYERLGVELRLIPDIVRNAPHERADVTLEWALAGRERGVVAIGLSGIEEGYPDEPFRRHFDTAESEGLHRVAHAGEHSGPEKIRSALDVAGAERIGHGVRAVEDPSLVAELAERGIPLEVCPTSNLCLGVFPDLASHSFDQLRRESVPVSVNSDDPPFFNTTLTDEYLRLHRTFGYGAEILAGLALGGLRQSFLPEERKAALEVEFLTQCRKLGKEWLGRPVEPRI